MPHPRDDLRSQDMAGVSSPDPYGWLTETGLVVMTEPEMLT